MKAVRIALDKAESAEHLRTILAPYGIGKDMFVTIPTLLGESSRSGQTHRVFVLGCGSEAGGIENLSAHVCAVLGWPWCGETGAVIVRDSGTEPQADVGHNLAYALWPEACRKRKVYTVRKLN